MTMQSASAGSSIYYTTDKSTPTSSILYTGAMTLTSSTTVNAKAFKSGFNPSAVASASFTNTPGTTGTGNIYYVATNGNDSSSGALSKPFRTIAKGVTFLQPGDTLYVREGMYAESLYCGITVCIPGGTSWSSPVTVAAYPGETVIIKPTSGVRVIGLEQPGQNFIIIDGFIIDGTNVGYDGIQIQNSAHHVRLQNTEIKFAPGQGINVGPGSNFNEFINNIIHDTGTNEFHHGIYISGSHSVLESNSIYNITGYGIHVYTQTSRASDNIARNNEIHDIGTRSSSAAGIILSGGDNNCAYNNIIWNSPIGIKTTHGGVSNSNIYNNTIYGSSDFGILIGSDSSTAIVKNNIAYSNGTDIHNESGSTTLSNNLTVDPKFIDISSFNFHLQGTSPAIDAGVTISEVVTDFDGISRAQGNDIGAYQYRR